jgi:hypothetical protein
MTHATRLAALLTALTTLAAPAFGGQPPDIVQSDAQMNTAMGRNALWALINGFGNTAVGDSALASNYGGVQNTAVGVSALYANSTAGSNTAVGHSALATTTTGSANTAVGAGAMNQNTTGYNNTAVGAGALRANQLGYGNVAVGDAALVANGSGSFNAALGAEALLANTTGSQNSAIGGQALFRNTIGWGNTALGQSAALGNVSGSGNTALGQSALYTNATGSGNIAIGNSAGANLTGSNNIAIGAAGAVGENGVIRIGSAPQQNTVYVAGIATTRITGATVVVNSAGVLGVLASSERYKTAIAPMGRGTERLQALKPVTFHLKDEPEGALQYGLIAEDVERVFPELVIHDAEGRSQGVRYDELAPMLLNEWQQQQARIAEQGAALAALTNQLAEIRRDQAALAAALAQRTADQLKAALH